MVSIEVYISRLRHFWQSVCAVAFVDTAELVPRERSIGLSEGSREARRPVRGLINKLEDDEFLRIELVLCYMRSKSVDAKQPEARSSHIEVQ